MREVVLDAREMTTREEAHALLARQLEFPGYYGRNLDALFDCLTAEGKPLSIRVEHADALRQNLGKYGALLLRVMQDAAQVNEKLLVYAEED